MSTAWTDQLETLEAPSLFEYPAASTRNAEVGLTDDLKHVSKTERRRMSLDSRWRSGEAIVRPI